MASKQKTNNPVAKHANRYNKSAVFKDRKKSEKKGYIKHKGRLNERPFSWLANAVINSNNPFA